MIASFLGGFFLTCINTHMKYYKLRPRKTTQTNLGRTSNPNEWLSGPCPETHDKYYAWLKHRAQARYRREEYDLTWEDWCELWTPELWPQRGKHRHSVCLQRIEIDGAWSLDNCEIVTRLEQLRRQREYKNL